MEKVSRLAIVFLFVLLISVTGGIALVIDAFTKVPDFTVLRRKVEVPIELPGNIKSQRWVGPEAQGWVPLSQISVAAMGAVIASEDTSFFSHQGVDYFELREAIKKDIEQRKFVRGASTLTQQVIKNVYLGHEKTLWRKFKEFFWAQEMSKVLTKSEILAFYLNMAEWGPKVYGMGEASRYYFGKSAATLSAKQGAFLALLLPSPKKYHSYFKNKELTSWAQNRVNKILKVMVSMKFISENEYEEALREKLWEIPEEKVREEYDDLPDENTSEAPTEPIAPDLPIEGE